jgi:hypothetical protein
MKLIHLLLALSSSHSDLPVGMARSQQRHIGFKMTMEINARKFTACFCWWQSLDFALMLVPSPDVASGFK